MGGWLRISDTEAANERYEDMRHFMHDPRTVAAMDKPDDMAPEVTVIPSGSLSAGDRVQLRAEGVIHSTHATITDGTDEAEA